ncbi:hypothetical protein G3O06_38180 [Burkholderia sp. Ac-20345]|nr:hypothetical protein [Burkholderia sp. Ac-20345]
MPSGFDIAIGIAELADSTLRSRRLCAVRRPLDASPRYLDKHGRSTRPREREKHAPLLYTNLPTPEIWRFRNARSGDAFAASVSGRCRANNGEVVVPALIIGTF